jgi:hypothetical protein
VPSACELEKGDAREGGAVTSRSCSARFSRAEYGSGVPRAVRGPYSA